MHKKKKIIIIGAIFIAILMSFFIGQTYARYLAQVNGKGAGEIANWSFKVNENENSLQTINLYSTLDNQKIRNNKIAPGTSGQFEIKIDGTDSDVGINYKVDIKNEVNKPANLIFKFQEKTFNSMTDLSEKLEGTINANDENKLQILSIQWEWKYETGTEIKEIEAKDLIDTQNTKDMLNYTFDVTVTGSQVDI